jgi:hypothetical protein
MSPKEWDAEKMPPADAATENGCFYTISGQQNSLSSFDRGSD